MQLGHFLGDGQPQPQAFDILHLALELNIGPDALDLFRRKSPAGILHGKFNLAVRRREPHFHE